jgi:hypothetical protein
LTREANYFVELRSRHDRQQSRWHIDTAWESSNCSRALLTWFDHGPIDLEVRFEQAYRWTPGSISLVRHERRDPGGVVERAQAHAILSAPETWTNEHPEGFLILEPSDDAPSNDFRAPWLNAIQPSD